jgi:thiamine pyrophosphate-dependent acetolactate synthase large subunit-like protein
MNSQELGTAVQLDLNLVVLEDRAYGMIRWKQEVDKADLPDSAQYVRCRGGERTSSFHNV